MPRRKLPTKSMVAAAAAKPAAKPAAKAAAKAAAKRGGAKAVITPEERFKMIEMGAYFRAEKSGFHGDSHQHWVQAEREVDALLAARGAKVKRS